MNICTSTDVVSLRTGIENGITKSDGVTISEVALVATLR